MSSAFNHRAHELTKLTNLPIASLVAVDGGWRECWQAHRDVLRAVGSGSAVADPLAGRGDHRLSRAHVERAAVVFDAKHSSQHDGDLLELGALSGLVPARRRHHARDADATVAGGDASRELFNALWY